MANEFNEKDFGKYEFDVHVVAGFLNLIAEETNMIKNTHEVGVESAEIHFDKRKAISGGKRTEKFLKDNKLSSEELFNLIELCANEEYISIYKKDGTPIILTAGISSDIYFFAVQASGIDFAKTHKK